jgi:hypothetical protein
MVAVLLQFTVTPASQDQFNELDVRVGEAMMQSGGSPDGLMSHVVYPGDGGFVVAGVWRMESDGQRFVQDVLHPLLARLDLKASETTVRPVWSFARP